MNPMEVHVPNIQELMSRDSYLKPYEQEFRRRYALYLDYVDKISQGDGSLNEFTKSYEKFGVHVRPDGTVTCLEWAPGAKALYLAGDFNNWNSSSHPYTRLEFGKWQLTLPPNADGSAQLSHLSEIKIVVETHSGEKVFRLSPWATYVVQPPEHEGYLFKQKIWNPPAAERYTFKHPHAKRPRSLRIYECHVGIGTNEPKIGSYLEFAQNVIPRVVDLGYNAIQVMAIMEHAYYASFGYQVTSYYAASSRFGTPEELKQLIDVAHEKGLYVLLDVVHSHASKNVLDGLNMFDGTDACYFHSGPRGSHPLWDSRLFNYSEYEVLRFLLSNLRFYMDEYQFDGFRFDGVTSMLYHSRGVGEFIGHYDDYFGMNVDTEALVYLMLANDTVHKLNPDCVTVAEEVSGMPASCRPVPEGGQGFDFRLGKNLIFEILGRAESGFAGFQYDRRIFVQRMYVIYNSFAAVVRCRKICVTRVFLLGQLASYISEYHENFITSALILVYIAIFHLSA